MRQLHFEQILLETGWDRDITLKIDPSGYIQSIERTKSKEMGKSITGAAIPGMPNLHSHAFQRAMAGLAEKRSSPTDSFWSWRKVMYGFLDMLEPEDVTAITAQLYVELMRGGYTGVAEFHYLHHSRTGQPYDDKSLMSQAVIEGAQAAGMPITLLPVFYAHAGFGGVPPEHGQRRFINNLNDYQNLFSELQGFEQQDPNLTLGVAPHSLRAATKEEIGELLKLSPERPFHIHIAEQQKEIEDCIASYGKRPVEWLYENFDVDKRWCLVHATHLTDAEITLIAKSKAIVGLCPLTEANLGDGIFPAKRFVSEEGSFGIGSDSNICLDVARELEGLEYGQRLLHQERNVLTSITLPNTGHFLYKKSVSGGARALGQPLGGLQIGSRADFVALDLEHPDFYGRDRESFLSILLFAAAADFKTDVYIAGEKMVAQGRHKREEEITRTYKARMSNLLSSL
ncbi:MAG: formimidoylglutamate deiminase [Sneathiella sp.]|uniref:formimidoylglutamate deiminase n=1 Tax=Sneathiella sp. TaxID=1964365 RepID=UPI000C566553|nr:formimidoylglutamate deiminase [Sneathiella sp.]MAZ04292.1 formimidoylglutamate deiminase [Sneathiella sp.]